MQALLYILGIAAILWGLKGLTSGGNSASSFAWKNVEYGSSGLGIAAVVLVVLIALLLFARR